MAKLPRTGVSYQFLYERDCTLPGVMASLGLKPLSRKAERKIRDRLGFALAKWEEPYSPVEVKDIVSSLNSHAKRLDEFAPLAAVAKGGFSRSDEIEVACRLAQILSEDSTVGSLAAAHGYLADFGDRAALIVSACRSAAKRLQPLKGKGGGSALDRARAHEVETPRPPTCPLFPYRFHRVLPRSLSASPTSPCVWRRWGTA